MGASIITGHVLEVLPDQQERSVQTCVTSPPYFGLRSYLPENHPDKAKEIGSERTPDEYIAKLVDVFRLVRRALRDDGTLWLNLGDSYAAHGSGEWGKEIAHGAHVGRVARSAPPGLKAKDLLGIPWAVAFALRADGWYLRSDIIWSKPNPMPESVTDRPTKAHEYVFLLSKSRRYFYDAKAIAEPAIMDGRSPRIERATTLQKRMPTEKVNGIRPRDKQRGHGRRHAGFNERWDAMGREQQCSGTRNKRSVWSISPALFSDAHFAVMPGELARTCIQAGSGGGGLVLDPFAGAGTVGVEALKLGREFVGVELNPEYAEMARARILGDAPLLNRVAVGD